LIINNLILKRKVQNQMKKQFLFFIILFFFVSNGVQSVEEQLLYSQEKTQKILYVYRPLINGDDLHKWAQEEGLSIISEDALHVTLAYSRNGLNGYETVAPDSNFFYNSDLEHFRYLDYFGKEKSVLVLKLNAPELVERWEDFVAAGANWDWPGFEPHITLTYDAKKIDISQINPYRGDLIFGPEIWLEFD
jgi:hypothetical protein